MIAEFMLSKRSVLRFIVAVLFFLLSNLHPIFIVFRCYNAMFVRIYVHRRAVAPIVFQPLPETDF